MNELQQFSYYFAKSKACEQHIEERLKELAELERQKDIWNRKAREIQVPVDQCTHEWRENAILRDDEWGDNDYTITYAEKCIACGTVFKIWEEDIYE